MPFHYAMGPRRIELGSFFFIAHPYQKTSQIIEMYPGSLCLISHEFKTSGWTPVEVSVESIMFSQTGNRIRSVNPGVPKDITHSCADFLRFETSLPHHLRSSHRLFAFVLFVWIEVRIRLI